MTLAALLTGILGLTTWGLGLADAAVLGSVWTHVALFFLIAVFHGGARLGRKVYLVDMANQDNRSTYVAVSNTVIGMAMLLGGAIGWLGDLLETASVIGVLGLLSLAGAVYIHTMKEVSG